MLCIEIFRHYFFGNHPVFFIFIFDSGQVLKYNVNCLESNVINAKIIKIYTGLHKYIKLIQLL